MNDSKKVAFTKVTVGAESLAGDLVLSHLDPAISDPAYIDTCVYIKNII